MKTKIESYRTIGNEKLLPLAVAGDADAEAVLLERGNTVEDGMATRVVKGTKIFGMSEVIRPNDDVTVQNGRVTKINGKAYP